MGLYAVPCSICKKVFMWFSGKPAQICEECGNKKVDLKEVLEAWKNFKPVIPLSFVVACRRAIREKYRG